MLAEFKAFVEQFNVLPIAIGLILAAAALPVIEALTNVLLTIIGKVGGLDDSFDAWAPAEIPVGVLITAIISFLIVAFALFMLVKALNKSGFGTTPAKTPDIFLLEEIRDLLAKK